MRSGRAGRAGSACEPVSLLRAGSRARFLDASAGDERSHRGDSAPARRWRHTRLFRQHAVGWRSCRRPALDSETSAPVSGCDVAQLLFCAPSVCRCTNEASDCSDTLAARLASDASLQMPHGTTCKKGCRTPLRSRVHSIVRLCLVCHARCNPEAAQVERPPYKRPSAAPSRGRPN